MQSPLKMILFEARLCTFQTNDLRIEDSRLHVAKSQVRGSDQPNSASILGDMFGARDDS